MVAKSSLPITREDHQLASHLSIHARSGFILEGAACQLAVSPTLALAYFLCWCILEAVLSGVENSLSRLQ